MKKSQRLFEFFAALGGFAGVVIGALAAHKVQDSYAEGLLRLASFYALIHSVALLVLAPRSGKAAHLACLFFAVGILLFCGGLCVKALVGATFIAKLVPGGGTCLMLGWLATAVHALTRSINQGA
jgi:uncharacterized membrane protein YgdD (TMEM256/DUF423 family)